MKKSFERMLDEAEAKMLSRNTNTYYHVTPWHIWERHIKTSGLIPRRKKRGVYGITADAIYLFGDQDTAEDAMINWLVDEFTTVRYFALIEVTLPADFNVEDDPEISGSFYTVDKIDPKYLKLIDKVDAGEVS